MSTLSAQVGFPEPSPGETEPYCLWATLRAKPGQGDILGERLLALVEPSRAEPGALEYHVHRDRKDPDRFTLYEAFASVDDFRAHLDTPYIQAFLADRASFMEGDFDTRFVRMISRHTSETPIGAAERGATHGAALRH